MQSLIVNWMEVGMVLNSFSPRTYRMKTNVVTINTLSSLHHFCIEGKLLATWHRVKDIIHAVNNNK